MFERWSDTGGKADPGVGWPGPIIEAVQGGKSLWTRLRCDGERKISREAADSYCQEKLLLSKGSPVPQTDTGRQEENSKMSGRSVVKELGKNTP
jgi:hypothetical protein